MGNVSRGSPSNPERHRFRKPVSSGLDSDDRAGYWQNHQVLAYAYEVEGDAVTLRIYDPNWPGRDDVILDLDSEGIGQISGEGLGGMLHLA